MCIRFIYDSNQKNKILDTLPDPFPVWKLMGRDGHTEYVSERWEPKIRRGINKAGIYKAHRSYLTYKPGYHAFISHEAAVLALDCHGILGCIFPSLHIRQFWARKEWVTTMGRCNSTYHNQQCVVLSYIEKR